jgi:hypothetical protein
MNSLRIFAGHEIKYRILIKLKSTEPHLIIKHSKYRWKFFDEEF